MAAYQLAAVTFASCPAGDDGPPNTPSEKGLDGRGNRRGQRVTASWAPRIFAVAVPGTGRGGEGTRPPDAGVVLAPVLFTITAPGRRPLMAVVGTPVGLAVPCPVCDYLRQKLRK